MYKQIYSLLSGVMAAPWVTINVLKFWNTFLSLFLDKMLVFRAGIHKILVRIANREDPDQTASSEAV